MQQRASESERTNKEIREWLGLAPADFPFYVAVMCMVGMYFTEDNLVLDVGLSVFMLTCGIVSCVVGMKRDPDLSQFTNVAKKACYPIAMVFYIGFIIIHFALLNG